jgi:hypothetical protein
MFTRTQSAVCVRTPDSTTAMAPATTPSLAVFFFLCVAALLPWPPVEAQPTPSPTLSGCQVCAASGDCSHAYLDGPGQYCGPWLDQANQKQRCCCPRDAICKLSNYACKCSRASTAAPAFDDGTGNAPANNVSTGAWIGVAVGGALFLSCCIGGCWCMVRVMARHQKKQQAHATATARPVVGAVPTAVPVAGSAVYAPGVSQYPYATTASAPIYDYGNTGYGHHHHHHQTGLSSAVGVVAGLATGMVIADIATDAFSGDGGHHYAAYDSGGDSGGFGGGGYDGGGGDGGGGGGDFGGDF